MSAALGFSMRSDKSKRSKQDIREIGEINDIPKQSLEKCQSLDPLNSFVIS